MSLRRLSCIASDLVASVRRLALCGGKLSAGLPQNCLAKARPTAPAACPSQ